MDAQEKAERVAKTLEECGVGPDAAEATLRAMLRYEELDTDAADAALVWALNTYHQRRLRRLAAAC